MLQGRETATRNISNLKVFTPEVLALSHLALNVSDPFLHRAVLSLSPLQTAPFALTAPALAAYEFAAREITKFPELGTEKFAGGFIISFPFVPPPPSFVPPFFVSLRRGSHPPLTTALFAYSRDSASREENYFPEENNIHSCSLIIQHRSVCINFRVEITQPHSSFQAPPSVRRVPPPCLLGKNRDSRNTSCNVYVGSFRRLRRTRERYLSAAVRISVRNSRIDY